MNKFFSEFFTTEFQQIFKNLGMIKHPAWISFGRKNGNKKCIHFFWITKSPFCIILRIADTRLERKNIICLIWKPCKAQHSFYVHSSFSFSPEYIRHILSQQTKLLRKLLAAHSSPFFQHTEKRRNREKKRKFNAFYVHEKKEFKHLTFIKMNAQH